MIFFNGIRNYDYRDVRYNFVGSSLFHVGSFVVG